MATPRDTDLGALDGLKQRPRLVAWMPDFTAGNLTLILTILGGFYHFGGTMSAITMEQGNMKTTAAAELVRSKEAITDMKQSVSAVDAKVSAVQDKLGTLAVTIAEIRATQQQRTATK